MDKLNKIYLTIFDSGIRSISLYKARYKYYKKNKAVFLFFQFLNKLFSPIHIDPKAEIGENLIFPHALCIVIGNCQIGKNVTIYQGVTLGLKKQPDEYPTIGDNVFIGTGAKVLGNVKVGSNSYIGANAVVLTDIPENSIAVGIPAKVKKIKIIDKADTD